MRTTLRMLALALLLSLAAGCGARTPTPTPPQPTAQPSPQPTEVPAPTSSPTPPSEDVLYVAIIWHQHQPLYFKDPQSGLYAKPWVRVHAAKDYVDMAALVEQYPGIQVTFNLTPSLLRQLDDIAAGAKDEYWALTEVPAASLTTEQQLFLLRRFFDTNRNIIARFPRYQELLLDRGDDFSESGLETTAARWTAQDFLDLQVLFNLAWTDPDWLAQDPLRDLVEKERGYTEADKAVVLDEHLRLVQEVVPIHRRLQEAGQIEVTMTPYAHPILPLLVNTTLAKEARPDLDLPIEAFIYGRDAIAHVQKGVALYEEHFARAPRGMWPAEGAVAQLIVTMVSQAGIQWMASDEEVLAYSLQMPGFSRDGQETLQEADVLYRPYYVSDGRNPPVAIVFRDRVLSDKVGFTYSGSDGELAAQDFVNRLHAIKERLEEQGAAGPHLVSVILDGENAWEYYDNDGKSFLHNLYRLLADDPELVTVTPSDFLTRFPEQRSLENLWAGSWINHDFTTWIGEEEENRAWQYLKTTRDRVQEYIAGLREVDEQTLAEVMDWVYAAEGSDWFWWFGADQDSGDDSSFDLQFRNTLMRVYELLGEEIPDLLYVPIIPERTAQPDQPMSALFSPTIDGVASEGEWDSAGVYTAAEDEVLQRLSYGFDAGSIYLRLDAADAWDTLADTRVGVYLSVPGAIEVNSFSRFGLGGEERTVLGFGAAYELALSVDNAGAAHAALSPALGDNLWGELEVVTATASSGQVLEVAIPFDQLGRFDAGDVLYLRAVVSQGEQDVQMTPGDGVAKVVVPDLGRTTTVLTISDPAGDDHGPGAYTYPLDGVFGAGCFDLLTFTVGYDEENIVFKLTMRGPVDNVWNSSNGLSVQTFDIYIDQDGPDGGGGRLLLPGRNAAVAEGDGWEYVLWIEGWTAGIFRAGPDGKPEQVDASFDVIADPVQRKVTVRVPKAVLGDTPEAWRYLAVVLGQEGYPSSGVWRVRDVEPQAAQWRFGGGPADTNHTRIIDVAWPAGRAPTQEESLGSYKPSQETNLDLFEPDDLAILPMVQME